MSDRTHTIHSTTHTLHYTTHTIHSKILECVWVCVTRGHQHYCGSEATARLERDTIDDYGVTRQTPR